MNILNAEEKYFYKCGGKKIKYFFLTIQNISRIIIYVIEIPNSIIVYNFHSEAITLKHSLLSLKLNIR